MKIHKLLFNSHKKSKKSEHKISTPERIASNLRTFTPVANASTSKLVKEGPSPIKRRRSSYDSRTDVTDMSGDDETIVDIVYDPRHNEYVPKKEPRNANVASNTQKKRKRAATIPNLSDISLVSSQDNSPHTPRVRSNTHHQTCASSPRNANRYTTNVPNRAAMTERKPTRLKRSPGAEQFLTGLQSAFPQFDYYVDGYQEQQPVQYILTPRQVSTLHARNMPPPRSPRTPVRNFTFQPTTPKSVGMEAETLEDDELSSTFDLSTPSPDQITTAQNPTHDQPDISIKKPEPVPPKDDKLDEQFSQLMSVSEKQKEEIEALKQEITKLKEFQKSFTKLLELPDILYTRGTEYLCDGWMEVDTEDNGNREKSRKEGIRYLKASALLGHSQSQFEYAEAVVKHEKSEKKISNAISYLKLAQENGYKKAGIFLQKLREHRRCIDSGN